MGTPNIHKLFNIFTPTPNKDVDLVLSSGGARGLAHIGAILALEERGYCIHSVAGASMGALIGGIYATGHLAEYRKWMRTIDRRKIFSLTDFSLGINHIVKGDHIIDTIKQFVPDTNIETLPIPFGAIATDYNSGREVIFSHGSLFQAIRASISIPTFFRPVEMGHRLLIDGGITNPLPLNRVKRNKKHLLVAVNVSGHDYEGQAQLRRMAKKHDNANFSPRSLLNHFLPQDSSSGDNYVTLISRTMSIMINRNARMALQMTPPDILIDLPMARYNTFDFQKSERLIRLGYKKTIEAIEKYEAE